jgi:di/tricarboxylate transporter
VSDNKNIVAIKKPVRLDFLFGLVSVSIVVLSFVIHEPVIVWYSWLIVTGYLFATIWLKEEKVRTKIKLTFSAFSALFMLPVASVVMSFSQRRSRN